VKSNGFVPPGLPGTGDLTQTPRAWPSAAAAEGLGTARFTKALEWKKRPTRRLWALVQLHPQTHHPDQPTAHTAFQTHWARLVSHMGHRSPHLRVLGAHFHHF
jgi:hypothetical protein